MHRDHPQYILRNFTSMELYTHFVIFRISSRVGHIFRLLGAKVLPANFSQLLFSRLISRYLKRLGFSF